jgi:hypothetical protein
MAMLLKKLAKSVQGCQYPHVRIAHIMLSAHHLRALAHSRSNFFVDRANSL